VLVGERQGFIDKDTRHDSTAAAWLLFGCSMLFAAYVHTFLAFEDAFSVLTDGHRAHVSAGFYMQYRRHIFSFSS
jgi:hypothetical protein